MNPHNFLDAVGRRPVWQDDGLCAQTDPDAFFLDKGGNPRPAKAVCQRCPVTEECLQYAIDRDEKFGIWGGKSEMERRKIANKRKKEFGPPQHDPDLIRRVMDLLGQDFHPAVVASLAGVSERTVRRIRDTQENGAAA